MKYRIKKETGGNNIAYYIPPKIKEIEINKEKKCSHLKFEFSLVCKIPKIHCKLTSISRGYNSERSILMYPIII